MEDDEVREDACQRVPEGRSSELLSKLHCHRLWTTHINWRIYESYKVLFLHGKDYGSFDFMPS